MASRQLPALLALLAWGCANSGDVPDDIGGACRRQLECSAELTAASERECRERLSAEYEDASGYGCSEAYADWVRCLASSQGFCTTRPSAGDATGSGGEPDPCQDTYDAFRRCQGRADQQ